MKKRIRKIFISMLFIYAGFCFAEPIVYTSTDEVQLLNGNYEPALLLDKNVSVYARNVYGADVGKSPEGELLCRIVYNGINYVADASKFVPKETKCVFDEDIISSALKNEKKALISKNYVDLLFSQDRDSVSKIEPYGYEQYNAYKTEFDYEWFLEVHEFNPSYIFNVVIGLHTIFGYYSFYVLDIEKEADGYKISAVIEKYWDATTIPQQVSVKKQTLTLTVDGDYLTIRSDEKTYGTFVIVSETLLSQGTSLLQNNTCDLSKVTWPRHADGTCDYEDGGKSAAESSVRKPAPATEHAEPAEEAALPEAAESENSNEEAESADADAKQNAALPILPIVVGGAALVIQLAVILFAAKKKKYEKK
ncbi:MAG: hypothetical protein K2N58_02390 [Treponemataceae bacterium]|nr:hypothetical protein [Treponemataceae bacterium]